MYVMNCNKTHFYQQQGTVFRFISTCKSKVCLKGKTLIRFSILAIANTKEIPGCDDPARFQVHCGIGRWQHCFRFGSCACGKCAFPAARRPGYYSASVSQRAWLPQIVQVPVPHFLGLILVLTSFPSFQFTFNCDQQSNGSFLRGCHCAGRTMINVNQYKYTYVHASPVTPARAPETMLPPHVPTQHLET